MRREKKNCGAVVVVVVACYFYVFFIYEIGPPSLALLPIPLQLVTHTLSLSFSQFFFFLWLAFINIALVKSNKRIVHRWKNSDSHTVTASTRTINQKNADACRFGLLTMMSQIKIISRKVRGSDINPKRHQNLCCKMISLSLSFAHGNRTHATRSTILCPTCRCCKGAETVLKC